MRKQLALVACMSVMSLTVCAGGGGGGAAAENYPEDCGTVEIEVGFSAGGATDLFFRVLADELTKQLGTDFQVVNNPGGGGATAINKVLNSPKDGCTVGNSALPSHLEYLFPDSPATYQKEDFSFVGASGHGRQVLVVRNDSPYHSMQDLIADAKAKGTIRAVADGPRGGDAIANAQIAKQTGINIKQVIVDGSAEKVTALLGGQVDFFTGAIGGVLSAIQSGQLRALAVMTEERSTALPDMPTAAEQGFDINAESRFAVFMPAGTPEEPRRALEDAMRAISQKDSYVAANADLGVETEFLTGAEYSQEWDEYVDLVKSLDLESLN